MFDISTITKVRFYPELLPGTDFYSSISAGNSASPSPLDIRQISNRVIELVNLSVNPDANIEFEVRTDKKQNRLRTLALDATKIYDYAFPVAKDNISFNILNVGTVAVSNYRAMYGIWVSQPTVADKLKLKWPLTDEDKSIADELGIYASVEKGVLPLPRSIVLEREYQILQSIVYPVTVNVPVSPNVASVLHVTVESKDEFIVLRSIACSDTTIASNISIVVNRDDDESYVTVKAPALGDVKEIECFIPSLREIKVNVNSVVPASGVNFRFKVITCRLTNTLRARWRLVDAESLPADISKKVKGGVL